MVLLIKYLPFSLTLNEISERFSAAVLYLNALISDNLLTNGGLYNDWRFTDFKNCMKWPKFLTKNSIFQQEDLVSYGENQPGHSKGDQ